MSYIFSFAVLIVVLFGNVLYIFEDVGFFDRQFVQLGSYERQENVLYEAQILMQYWHNDDVLVASDVYTQAEKDHLYDVKKLLVGLCYAFLIASFLLLATSLWFYFRGFTIARVFAAFRVMILSFLLFALALGLGAWLWWDCLFDVFHRLLFVDNWLFPADSFLIQSYPWQFFRNAMVLILLRSFGLFLVLGLVFFIAGRKEKLV